MQQIKVEKAKIVRLKAKKGGKVFLKIKKIKGVKGYKITYSKKAGFKKVKNKYISKNKCTIKKMKKGIYYFKASAYKIDSYGNKIYGEVSGKKKIYVNN